MPIVSSMSIPAFLDSKRVFHGVADFGDDASGSSEFFDGFCNDFVGHFGHGFFGAQPAGCFIDEMLEFGPGIAVHWVAGLDEGKVLFVRGGVFDGVNCWQHVFLRSFC